jgi:hypothetical protein
MERRLNVNEFITRKALRRYLSTAAHRFAFTSRLLSLYYLAKSDSYLSQSGWFEAKNVGRPVDKEKAPIPWLTYPAIAFLSNRINRHWNVFEWGSGQSTLWWASRVETLFSCEHNKIWYELILPHIPANVRYLHRPFSEDRSDDYARAILETDMIFDVVVIDAVDRIACAKNAPKRLNECGIIIWDNRDYPQNVEGYLYLERLGFRCIDFEGLTALSAQRSVTGFFYRPGNCMGV